jgi:hypothetical protein
MALKGWTLGAAPCKRTFGMAQEAASALSHHSTDLLGEGALKCHSFNQLPEPKNTRDHSIAK